MRAARHRPSLAADRSRPGGRPQPLSALPRALAARAAQGAPRMSTLTFLNATLLWGLGLASIPLIIHLLFRRKFRRIEWAPMRYLKLTIQRNRRRIQIEQLLLLLLRTALILLLVCIIARPVVNAAGIRPWVGGGTRTGPILLLGDP